MTILKQYKEEHGFRLVNQVVILEEEQEIWNDFSQSRDVLVLLKAL